jgi:hypothetical protein
MVLKLLRQLRGEVSLSDQETDLRQKFHKIGNDFQREAYRHDRRLDAEMQRHNREVERIRKEFLPVAERIAQATGARERGYDNGDTT